MKIFAIGKPKETLVVCESNDVKVFKRIEWTKSMNQTEFVGIIGQFNSNCALRIQIMQENRIAKAVPEEL